MLAERKDENCARSILWLLTSCLVYSSTCQLYYRANRLQLSFSHEPALISSPGTPRRAPPHQLNRRLPSLLRIGRLVLLHCTRYRSR